jgi:hypothetical protein
MKNFVNLTLDVLSNEELMAVKGGDAPIDPTIIHEDRLLFSITKIKKHNQ